MPQTHRSMTTKCVLLCVLLTLWPHQVVRRRLLLNIVFKNDFKSRCVMVQNTRMGIYRFTHIGIFQCDYRFVRTFFLFWSLCCWISISNAFSLARNVRKIQVFSAHERYECTHPIHILDLMFLNSNKHVFIAYKWDSPSQCHLIIVTHLIALFTTRNNM